MFTIPIIINKTCYVTSKLSNYLKKLDQLLTEIQNINPRQGNKLTQYTGKKTFWVLSKINKRNHNNFPVIHFFPWKIAALVYWWWILKSRIILSTFLGPVNGKTIQSWVEFLKLNFQTFFVLANKTRLKALNVVM